MTNEELEAHFQSLGWKTEHCLVGSQTFIIIRDYMIPTGNHIGRTCDVAIERTTTIPYVSPPAIHTRPALVPLSTLNTMQSPLGPDWQYWSRLVRVQPTPQKIVAHIATIFSEV